jgi:hypothetical protein
LNIGYPAISRPLSASIVAVRNCHDAEHAARIFHLLFAAFFIRCAKQGLSQRMKHATNEKTNPPGTGAQRSLFNAH